MRVIGEDNVDKVRAMKDVPYKALAVIESASAEDGITFREDD